MSEKSFKKSEFKRTIDLGKTERGQDTDLIRVWRESSGEEKAISLGDINGGLIGDYVPYTGAVDDVDLGEKGISGGYVKYDTTPTATPTDQGTSYWDVDDNTLAIIMNGTTLKVGEDQYYPVKNQTGVLIPKGTAVRFAGTLGASGRLLIAPFIADGSLPSSRFMGVTSEDIGDGEDGKVMWFGRIRGINTNAFNQGDILYASTTVAGGFQTTIPVAPNNIVEVCAVVHKGVSNGIIFVRPTFISSVEAGAGLSIDGAGKIQLGEFDSGENLQVIKFADFEGEGLYIIGDSATKNNFFSVSSISPNLYNSYLEIIAETNNNLISNIGITGIGGSLALSIYKISGISVAQFIDEINSKGLEYPADYSANWTDHSLVTKSWVLGQISGAGHNPVTIGSPANGLSISGTQVLTIGLASAGVTGALSGTDWNTFNGKIGGSLTSGRIPFATGANALSDDADLTWDDVNNIFSITGKANINFGTSNLLIGLNAGAVISTGNSNIAIGALSLNATTSGVSNTGLGSNTLRSNITSSNNTAIGGNALLNALLGANLAIGVNAGRWFTGLNNAQNITGSIFIGNNSQAFSNTSSGEIVIGVSAVGLGNNTTVIGTVATVATVFPAGSLWVNTTSGTNTLDVNGTARIRTISNLGVSATNVLVPDATGVVSLRTATQFLADAGGISGTIASGQVAFGTGVNTVGGSADFVFSTSQLTINRAAGNSRVNLQENGVTVTSLEAFLGAVRLRNQGNGNLEFWNNGVIRWSILSTGQLESNGSNTIRTSTGNLTLATNGGNGNILLTPNGTGLVMIGSGTPTNLLDVNGTARIRTISNLGTAATSVLVPSATGVVSLRTLAELASDGLGSKWTDVTGGIFRNGAVAVGRTTIPSNATFAVQSLSATDAHKFVQFLNDSSTELFSVQRNGVVNIPFFFSTNGGSLVSIVNHIRSTVNSAVPALRISNLANTVLMDVPSSGGIIVPNRIHVGASAYVSGIWNLIRGQDNSNLSSSLTVQGLAGTTFFDVRSDGEIRAGILSTKIGFFGSTAIVKPSGDILTALSNLGLVASPTITPIDQLAVKTTASADQTLPSGTLTILDYDTTVINNSTPTYTVATNGRITINTTGIYTITAGVVVEADAITALESAFLGIFRNGDLVAISSINTTIAAGAQSGLTTSTILSLTATDIIDCRALVNSVGGVANGLARRLGTLLGANATQVNSLSITKNSQ